MRLLWSVIAMVLLTSCVVPFPLEPEPAESKTPPRFLRDRITPQFKVDVEIDSLHDLTLYFVVEDPDVYDEIPFRIYRDYALVSDSQKLTSIVIMGGIPGADPTQVPEEEAPWVREQAYPLQKKLFCSSERGDVSGTQHYIEVVIADAFNANSEIYPKWRATLTPADVWGFVVVCIQTGKKAREMEP
jgi:hypothetical protein